MTLVFSLNKGMSGTIIFFQEHSRKNFAFQGVILTIKSITIFFYITICIKLLISYFRNSSF